jgi:hypothetical protein
MLQDATFDASTLGFDDVTGWGEVPVVVRGGKGDVVAGKSLWLGYGSRGAQITVEARLEMKDEVMTRWVLGMPLLERKAGKVQIVFPGVEKP